MLSITWMTGHAAGDLADHHAHLPGGGGGHAHGQLVGHPDRRLPRQPAGDGPRGQPGRRLQRDLHRAGPRRRAGPDQLAAHLPGLGARSGCSPPCSAISSCGRPAQRRPARIDWPGNITFAVGLILVMVGITYGIEPYGHHVMGWTNPTGARLPSWLGVVLLIAFCVIETKVARADVPPPAVQDPGLHQRRPRQLPGRAEPRRTDVHADHLAAGDLAAAARLRLQP